MGGARIVKHAKLPISSFDESVSELRPSMQEMLAHLKRNNANLRVRSQTSSAHLQDSPLILDIVKCGGTAVISAARLTVSHHGAQLELL